MGHLLREHRQQHKSVVVAVKALVTAEMTAEALVMAETTAVQAVVAVGKVESEAAAKGLADPAVMEASPAAVSGLHIARWQWQSHRHELHQRVYTRVHPALPCKQLHTSDGSPGCSGHGCSEQKQAHQWLRDVASAKLHQAPSRAANHHRAPHYEPTLQGRWKHPLRDTYQNAPGHVHHYRTVSH